MDVLLFVYHHPDDVSEKEHGNGEECSYPDIDERYGLYRCKDFLWIQLINKKRKQDNAYDR